MTRSMPCHLRLAAAWLSPALLLTGACGYHMGLPGAEKEHRIAVAPFLNRTLPLRRDLETTLTSAVHEELRRMPGLLVAAGGAAADATLDGALVEVREATLLETERDQPRSLRVTVSVYARLRDAQGAPLWDGTLHEQGDTNLLSTGSTTGAGTRDEALERAFRQVARSLAFALARALDRRSAEP